MNTLITCIGLVCSVAGAPAPLHPQDAARVLSASSSQRFIAAPPEQAGPQWVTVPRPAPLPLSEERRPRVREIFGIRYGLPHQHHAKHRR